MVFLPFQLAFELENNSNYTLEIARSIATDRFIGKDISFANYDSVAFSIDNVTDPDTKAALLGALDCLESDLSYCSDASAKGKYKIKLKVRLFIGTNIYSTVKSRFYVSRIYDEFGADRYFIK